LLLKLRLELGDFLKVQLVLSSNVWLVVLEEFMHILNFSFKLCQLDAFGGTFHDLDLKEIGHIPKLLTVLGKFAIFYSRL